MPPRIRWAQICFRPVSFEPMAHGSAEHDATVATRDMTGRVPTAQIGSGTTNGAKFLRDDRTWADPPDATGTPADSVANETAFGVVAAAGASATYSRGDHTHGSPTNPVTAHEAASDPHTGYQRESEKNAVNGYAGLDGSTKVAGTQIVYGTAASTACQGNDARLSDARTPTAHVHAPGDVTGTAVITSDARLTDARTPTAHAASHKSAGGDAVKLDELAAPTDVTTLNATTALHGLLPKLGGGTTNFLRADGAWAAPTATVNPFAPYDPGTLTVPTENYMTMVRHLVLTTTERLTVEGTARLVIQN